MSVYSRVPVHRPGRSVFNLSHEHMFDCDMGKLVPVMATECVPGDTMKLGNNVVIRFNPMVAPMMSEVNAYVHYFFVPNRIVWDDWEEFITGGDDGQSSVALPRWQSKTGYNSKYTLWDYFGLPVGKNPALMPLDFPKRCYNKIFNDYYRDETLQEEVDLLNDSVLNRNWQKDYFTSALPWQQKGIAPALPITGILPVASYGQYDIERLEATTHMEDERTYLCKNGYRGEFEAGDSLADPSGYPIGGVDLSGASTFNVSDFRLAFQIQKWMERNAQCGSRYTEFLRSHFAVSPRDERLQRPEYIGGSKSPVVVSEVLQTSETTNSSPQGNLAGHGISASSNYVATYTAKEFGWIIGILSVMPKASYMQGVPRNLLRETRYDFYFPEFAHLSEQNVYNEEIYADGTPEDTDTFGYQGRYNELRSQNSIISGAMRDTLSYWHLARSFDARPNLNGTFITCEPSKRVFAVQNVPCMIVNVGNVIKAIRPLPYFAEPGLIDHN